jgi:hypothetical protein
MAYDPPGRASAVSRGQSTISIPLEIPCGRGDRPLILDGHITFSKVVIDFFSRFVVVIVFDR